jgi:hypothetical protein
MPHLESLRELIHSIPIAYQIGVYVAATIVGVIEVVRRWRKQLSLCLAGIASSAPFSCSSLIAARTARLCGT